jgi:hypothetical protein
MSSAPPVTVADELAELRARAASARARRDASALTPDQTETHRLLCQEAEDLEAARAAEKAARQIRGMKLEAEERKKAGGRYLVRAVDLAALLPDADPASLPGEGVIVVRSAPAQPDALGDFLAELEKHDRSHPDIFLDLVCASTVYPDVGPNAGPGVGERFRAFFESSIGRGTVLHVGDQVSDLSGVRARRVKRGRG